MRRPVVKHICLTAEQSTEWKTHIREFPCKWLDNDLYSYSPQEAIEKVTASPGLLNDNYVLALQIALATVPDILMDLLAGFGQTGSPDAVMLDLGPNFFQIDPSRDMPVNGRRNILKPFGFDEIAQLGIIHATGGYPFSLIPEAGLDLPMPVSPAPGKEKTYSSKSKLRLGWHVDNLPFAQAFRPDYFALTGLVATDPVITSYALMDDVLSALWERNPQHEQILREPFFSYCTPRSFHFDGSDPVLSTPMPIIAEGMDGRPVFNFNEYTLIADRKNAHIVNALAALSEVLCDQSVIRGEQVSPGKVLLLSNTRALHARGEVRGQRYLARLYAKRDLGMLRGLKSGGDRVYPFRFMMDPAEVFEACQQGGPKPQPASEEEQRQTKARGVAEDYAKLAR